MKKTVVILLLIGLSAGTALAATTAYAETNSFSGLMAAGQSVECSYTKADGSQNGTIYIGPEKLRSDMQISEGGSTFPMHMIRDAQKMYTWGGPMGEKQGMIMPANMAGPMGGPQTANMDEEMDFSCRPWAADEAKFEPPSDIEFQDMGQLMGAYAAASGAAGQ